jgi:hypothetical protein
MDGGEILRGAGFSAAGIAFYGLKWWQMHNDRLMQRAAEAHSRGSRFTITGRKRRHSGVPEDEHMASWIRGQRWMLKWLATPFFALWTGLWLAEFIRGLLAH